MQTITETDWQTLLEHAQHEIYNFFLFLKARYTQKQLNQNELETRAFANHSANTIEDWLNTKEDAIWM